MEMLDILKFVILPMLIAYVGFNEKHKANLANRLNGAISRAELERAVEQAKEIHSIQIKEIQYDINKLEKKIDKLIEALTHFK